MRSKAQSVVLPECMAVWCNYSVQERLVKLLPCGITLGVAVALCLIRAMGLLEGIELLTFDARAKIALRFPFPLATNLVAVELDEPSLDTLKNLEFGEYRFPFPRSVYGRVVHELKAQGASVVAIDLFFLDLDRDYAENRGRAFVGCILCP